MKTAITIAAALAVSGCVNQVAQQQLLAQAAAASAEYQHRFQAESTRCRSWLGDSRFARIAPRLAEREPTPEQLADAGRPTASERALLVQWSTILDDCSGWGFGPPNGVTSEQRRIALASLASGELTYGGYNRKIAETRSAARAESERAAAQAAATAAATQAGVQAAIAQAQREAAERAMGEAIAAGLTAAIFSSGRRR